MTLQVTDSDLPALFIETDRSAIKTRQHFFAWLFANLLLTATPEALDVIESKNHALRELILPLDFLIIAAAVITTILIFSRQFDRKWLSARAAAEQIRAMSWRYMTKTGEFAGEDNKKADTIFSDKLEKLIERKAEMVSLTSGDELSWTGQITEKMRSVRQLSTSDRLQCYVDSRLNDQLRYYRGKSRATERQHRRWFIAIVITQILTLGAAYWYMHPPSHEHGTNLIGLAIAASIFCIGWLQANKFGELALSYSIAAHNLLRIQSTACNVTTEEEFKTLVSDAEQVIYEENKSWIARSAA